MTPPEKYIPAKMCAEMLEIHRATWWRWVREGKTPNARKLPSGRHRWALSEIEAMMEKES